MIRLALAALSLVLATSAAAQSEQGLPRWAAGIARKQQVIMYGLPLPYSGTVDPQPDTRAKIRRGAVVFRQHCSACHGTTGEGTGPASFAMVPVPADLEWLTSKPKNKAGPYMYWAIAEGGLAFGSDMPAFKRTLSKRDIWAVIAYVRAGLPNFQREDRRNMELGKSNGAGSLTHSLYTPGQR